LDSSVVATLQPGPVWRYNLFAYWVVAALITMLGVLHVALVRGMFADGAFYLLAGLSSQSFVDFNKARMGAQLVFQLPLMGAIAAGADSVKFLARVQTFGFVFPVVLLYLGGLWKVRTNDVLFGAFILVIAVIYQNLNFMAIGEYNLLYALVTFSLAVLVQDKELSVLDSLLLVVCALVSIRAYEAMAFLGPMLIAACVLRILASKPTGLVTVALGAAVILFALGSVLAVLSILAPQSPTNLDNAIHGLILPNTQMWLSFVLAAAFAVYVMFSSRLLQLAMISVFVVALVTLIIPMNWSLPKLHYFSRTPAGLALFAIGVALIIFRFSRLYGRTATIQSPGFAGILVVAPLLALMVLSAPDVYHSIGWKQFLNSIEREVNAKTGLIPYEVSTKSLKRETKYGWGWTYPSMSILTRHGPSYAIILNPVGSWQPFDPSDSGNIPDMHGYYWN